MSGDSLSYIEIVHAREHGADVEFFESRYAITSYASDCPGNYRPIYDYRQVLR